MTGLPRVSISGTLILGSFLATIWQLFRSSVYYSVLWVEGGRWDGVSCFLHAVTCATSFLNVLSHAGVVLGVLNDTYVLSILVGVGFDVVTRILQLVWWIRITTHRTLPVHGGSAFQEKYSSIGSDASTVALLLVLSIVYVYHMMVHVRALCLNQSLARMQTVLTGALNNLRGIPGEGYVDHVFAYTDLGTHLLAFGLSGAVLQREGALFLAGDCLLVLAGLSYAVLSRIPFQNIVARDSTTNQLASMIRVWNPGKDNHLVVACSCEACSRRQERQKGHPASFTCNTSDGICQLWLGSFEQLSGILSSATTQS